MKYMIMTLFLLLPYSAQTENLIADSPRVIKEYGNFYIKLHKIKNFTVNISNPCLAISHIKDVTESNGKYTSEEDGKIYFDNLCFEQDEVIITIKNKNDSETVKFRIMPREIFEQDFGC